MLGASDRPAQTSRFRASLPCVPRHPSGGGTGGRHRGDIPGRRDRAVAGHPGRRGLLGGVVRVRAGSSHRSSRRSPSVATVRCCSRRSTSTRTRASPADYEIMSIPAVKGFRGRRSRRRVRRQPERPSRRSRRSSTRSSRPPSERLVAAGDEASLREAILRDAGSHAGAGGARPDPASTTTGPTRRSRCCAPRRTTWTPRP